MSDKANYIWKCIMTNKPWILTTTCVSPTQFLESSIPALGTLPGRYTLFCWWVTFHHACLVLLGGSIAPTWRSMACTGDSIEMELVKLLQAWMPSLHVWSNFVLPAFPQLLNQAPPRAQQLRLPDFLLAPHLTHLLLSFIAGALVFIFISVGICAWEYSTRNWNRCPTKFW